MNLKILEETGSQLLRIAETRLPKDVKKALKKAYEKETAHTAKIELGNILKNIDGAERLGLPICQDTGMICFFIKSRGLHDYKPVHEALVKATLKATSEVPLRPNAVHPLTRVNSGDNTGEQMPNVQWIYKDIDHVELTAFPKGAGSENMSKLAMLTPGMGVRGVKKFVLDTVVNAGGQPCPPTVLGIGIGGTVDLTFKLAKLALLRPIGQRNNDENVANLEEELIQLLNKTGIGPMGLGGRTTVLDVKIEYAYCHTGSLPVGVNIQCWANRKATANIYPDGAVEYLNE